MDEFIFNTCAKINTLLNKNHENDARNELIQLLDYLEKNQIEYSELVNHLIRETGLYPYIHKGTASWADQFVYEAFKVDTGDNEEITIHREQSRLLKELLQGKNIAVSAPTSFGKSFIIDAFIAIKRPKTAVIIVPTIALADETRRRLNKKFAKNGYKIITTQNVELNSEYNILIFPQERAISYANSLVNIDILIIDEFYKASISYDKERAPILLKAILELSRKSKQEYFLAPNISEIKNNPITEKMKIIKLDFTTVFSEIHELYNNVQTPTDDFKKEELLKIIGENKEKSLIYAGTFSNIDKITNILRNNLDVKTSKVLTNFSSWLRINYGNNYILSDLVEKGIGIHNGRLHRSLSQIQVKLFEEDFGINDLVTTSSIIEGVNTSAENVIIWTNKNGGSKFNSFTYKNIIGRGGRMFKHFIGKIYLLDKPPKPEPAELDLEYTDELINSLDKDQFELTVEQFETVAEFTNEMDNILGKGVYEKLLKDNLLQSFSPKQLKIIAYDMRENIDSWNGLAYLNSDNPNDWDSILFKILNLVKNVGDSYTNMVVFIKTISNNWNTSIPNLLRSMQGVNITVDKFFELEKNATFKVASMVKLVNYIYNLITKQEIDVSLFTFKLSNAFLPRNVYELEEYGLPRMLSKKISDKKIIDLENDEIPLHSILLDFLKIGKDNLVEEIGRDLHPFELYILDYFYDGIIP